MLLINFICLFYLMVLVRCDAISKSESNIESYNGFTNPFNMLRWRQVVTARTSKSHPVHQRKPWLFMVPFSDYSTAALEEVLNNLKHKDLQEMATSPLGSAGMVFATESGFSSLVQNGFSTVRPTANEEKVKHTNHKTQDSLTKFGIDLPDLDQWKIKATKNKLRTAKEAVKEPKEEKKKFKFNDMFKFLHPTKKKKTENQSKELIKQVPVLPTHETSDKSSTEVTKLITIGSTTKVTGKHGLKKEKAAHKKNRTRRTADDRNTDVTTQEFNKQKFIPYLRKREAQSDYDTRILEMLTNKLAYKDFVDGYKYYLNFERDMAKSNFSNMVRYEAHKHHNVEDIGKFILEKLPQVPMAENYKKPVFADPDWLTEEASDAVDIESWTQLERVNASTDSDLDARIEKYDIIHTTNVPTNLRSLNSLKRRLADIQKPLWLSKNLNDFHFDFKAQKPRRRRSFIAHAQNTIRFDTTEFPHALKSDTILLKASTKNIAVAKLNLVQASKTQKPKSFFRKFMKHKTKRDAQKAGNSILQRLKNIFNCPKSTTAKGLTVRYRLNSNLYDLMNGKFPMYKPAEINDLDDVMEKLKKPAAPRQTTQFSYLDAYDREAKNTVLSVDFHPDPDVPFELTTPPVKDPALRKKLHKLQKQHDSEAARAKAFEAEYKSLSTSKYDKPAKLKDSLTIVVQNKGDRPKNINPSRRFSTLTRSTAAQEYLETIDMFDEMQDLLTLSHKPKERTSTRKLATLKSYTQTPIKTKDWQINDNEFGNILEDYGIADRSIPSSTPEIPIAEVEDNPANHFNIKPSMFNDFDVTEPSLMNTRKWNVNIKTKTTPVDSELPALEKPGRSMTNMQFGAKKLLKTASDFVKSNKILIDNEFHKKRKTPRGMGFRVADWSWKNNNDEVNNNGVVMVQTSTMLLAKDTESAEDNYKEGDYLNDGVKIGGYEVPTPERSRYPEKGKSPFSETKNNEVLIGTKHTESVFDEKTLAAHNKLIHGDLPCKTATAKTVTNAKKLISKPLTKGSPVKGHSQVTIKDGGTKGDKTEQLKNEKTTTKPKVPHLLPTPWTLGGPDIENIWNYEDDNIHYSTSSQKASYKNKKVSQHKLDPSNMLDKFKQDFPEFEKIGKSTSAMRSHTNWFEKHYSNSSFGKQPTGKEKEEQTTIGHIIKDWWDKQITQTLNKETKSECDMRKKPIDKKGKANKLTSPTKPYPATKLTLTNKTTQTEEMTVLDVGRLIKDWLTTTMKPVNNEKNGKTPREMTSQLPHDSNSNVMEDRTIVNKNKETTSFRTVNDVANGVQELNKPYYNTKKPFSTNSYRCLFKAMSYPNTEKNHGYGLHHNSNKPFAKFDEITNKADAKFSKDTTDIWNEKNSNQAPSNQAKNNDYIKSETKSPGNVKIMQTYNIIYAHGKIPFTNRSINQMHAIYKEITNTKKRNLHKPNTKLKSTTKYRRRKRFTGIYKSNKIHENNKVRFKDKPDQDDGEIKLQKRKRQVNIHAEDLDHLSYLQVDPLTVSEGQPASIPADMPRGMYILLVNCSANLPRGNYLLKPLADGAFGKVINKMTRETNSSYNRDEALEKADNEIVKLKELEKNEFESKGTRRKRACDWKVIKKWFHGARACSCKCKAHKTMCAACAASDAVMTEVIFRLANIVNYVNGHTQEIEKYFMVNPKSAAKFRDAVKETDKCLKNYSKRSRGQCRGKLCEAFKYVQDRDVDDFIDVS